MASRMKSAWIGLSAALVLTVVGLLVWVGSMPSPPRAASGEPTSHITAPALRLGLIPERDILAQRARYRALGDYLEGQLNRPIELVTVNTYSSVLIELEQDMIDAAFVGSMVAALAHDRHGVKVLVKPETADGVSTYRGVLFVREDSPIREIDDLDGRSVAMVRTTTAGNLFPIHQFVQRDMLDGPNAARLHWAGTHDDAVRAVAEGTVEAGAAKDLRLQAMEAIHPEMKFRRLAVSDAVPNNALIAHRDLPMKICQQLSTALVKMHETEQGRAVLETFGAQRFLPCTIEEYAAIYEMVGELGSAWSQVGVEGPPPTLPEELASPPDP